MKILNKLLILFTSVLSLAVLSAASVFMTAPKAHQQGLSVDLSVFRKIQFPKVMPQNSQAVSLEEQKDSFELIKVRLTKSYQEATYSYYKGAFTEDSISTQLAANKTEKKLAPSVKKAHNKKSNAINDNELIHHFGFKASVEIVKLSWAANYQSLNVAQLINDTKDNTSALLKNEDKVNIAASSLEKDGLDENWEEEMVFIDYSQEAKDSLDTQQESEESPALDIESLTDHMDHSKIIPDSVLSVINREMDKRQAVPTKATVNIDANLFAASSKTPEVMNTQPATLAQNEYSQNTFLEVNNGSVSILSIHEANIEGVNTHKELRNFEFNSEVLSTQRLTDDVNGKIVIKESLSGPYAIARGTFLKHGYMRTKIDLVMARGERQVDIPLLSQDQLGNFLDAEGLVARGGYVMAHLPQTANTVDIDRTYEAKVYLSRDFAVVDQEDMFEYVLFVGVSPGNALLTYQDFKGKKAQKIIHIVEDEVYFDQGSFVSEEKIKFQLKQKNLLGSRSSDYNLYPDQITYFNTSIESQQEAVAAYSILSPQKSLGSRNYLKIKSGRFPYYVGLWNRATVEVPSESFSSYVLESHQLRNLENACMVQVNIKKPISEVVVSGENQQGQMGILKTYLDSDGQFNYEPSQMASHIFLVGDTQGQISLKVTYLDATTDILKTFCSENTYLIEQL